MRWSKTGKRMEETDYFNIIDDVTVREIARNLPGPLVIPLRETCRRMRFALRVPQRISVNMLLRAAVRIGSRDLCEFARARGAIVFQLMLKDAAYYGCWDLCELAMKWQCEFRGIKQGRKEILDAMKTILIKSAKGMKRETFDRAAQYFAEIKEDSSDMWSKCLGAACLSDNIAWFHYVLDVVETHVEHDFIQWGRYVCGNARKSVKMCGTVFGLANPADDERITIGNIPEILDHEDVCAFWLKRSYSIAKDGSAISVGTFIRVAAEMGKRDKVEMIERLCPKINLQDVGNEIMNILFNFARNGWDDLLDKYEKFVTQDDFADYYETIVSGALQCEDEKNGLWLRALDRLEGRMNARLTKYRAFGMAMSAMKSRVMPRIEYVISHYEKIYPNFREELQEHYGNDKIFRCSNDSLAIFGTILPSLNSQRVRELLVLYFSRSHKKGVDIKSHVEFLQYFMNLVAYCRKMKICVDLAENLRKSVLNFGSKEDFLTKSENVPLIA